MPTRFMLYGATGFVGQEIARLAVERGLQPVLGARNAKRLEALADELGVECRAFDLRHPEMLDDALDGLAAVLNCAGPFIHTVGPMVDACVRAGTHYLDLSGEIPVYQALAERDAEAKTRGVMLLPGTGFDVVPTDCLALHLKRRLPSATHLTLAFQIDGPGGFPPGTQRTGIEVVFPSGTLVRGHGRLERASAVTKTRPIDFGRGPVQATLFPWGDVFTAFRSTGIPNIEDYTVLSVSMRRQIAAMSYLRPLLKLAPVRALLKLGVTPGPTPEARARTVTNVWGEVEDDQDRRAVARLHGPEAGVEWTARAALAAVGRVLAGDAPPGYQTPGTAYGSDFVMAVEGVTRQDLA